MSSSENRRKFFREKKKTLKPLIFLLSMNIIVVSSVVKGSEGPFAKLVGLCDRDGGGHDTFGEGGTVEGASPGCASTGLGGLEFDLGGAAGPNWFEGCAG